MTSDVFIPEDDITQRQPDGTSILLAAKGVPVPMAEARKRGLVKDRQTTGPTETKAETSTPEPLAADLQARLDAAGVTDPSALTDAELLAVEGIGPASLARIRAVYPAQA